jgi:hypothetical protein
MVLAQTAATADDGSGWWEQVLHFIDTPAPYSPFSEYLLVLFILWLLARRENRSRSFDSQAQEVLDQKYASGEISKKAYDKFRQQMTVRPKR